MSWWLAISCPERVLRHVSRLHWAESRVPTLGVWSDRDEYLVEAFAHARASAPLRPGEGLALHWAFDFEQPIQAPSRIVLHLCAQYIARWHTTPRLGLTYH